MIIGMRVKVSVSVMVSSREQHFEAELTQPQNWGGTDYISMQRSQYCKMSN